MTVMPGDVIYLVPTKFIMTYLGNNLWLDEVGILKADLRYKMRVEDLLSGPKLVAMKL